MQKNVLILEDNEIDLLRIVNIVKSVDAEINIISTKGYDNAKLMTKRNKIDLAIVDLFMDDEYTGTDYVHEVLKMDKKDLFPIVIVSAASKNSIVKEILADKVQAFVHKPFKQDELKNIIIKLLS